MAESIAHIKTLPINLHEKIAAYCLSAFNCTLTTETGSMTFAHITSLYLWFKIGQCINNENDAKPYEICADKLYKLVCDDGEDKLYQWWINFWCIMGTKYPNVAVKHISQFLHDVIDRKQFTLVSIVSVSFGFSCDFIEIKIFVDVICQGS